MGRFSILTAAALIFAIAGSVQADMIEPVVIDSFESGSQLLFVHSASPTASSITEPSTLGALGGYRDALLQWLSGGGASLYDAALSASPSLNFTQAATGTALAEVVWDGDGQRGVTAFNLGEPGVGVDLTAGGAMGLLIRINGSHGQMNVSFTLYGQDAENYASYTHQLTSDTTEITNVFLPFSNFTVIGSTFSPSNVGAVKMTLSGSAGGDISIDTVAAAVPEPSALALALLAVPALAVGYRLRRRSAA